MKRLIEWVILWTSGHECVDCDIALAMLKDISKRKDNSRHTFKVHITCHKDTATEFHIAHHNSK